MTCKSHLLLQVKWDFQSASYILDAESWLALAGQGVYGWRLQPEVKVYSSYEVGDAPPEPEHVDLDDVDPAAARAELMHLGIIPA